MKLEDDDYLDEPCRDPKMTKGRALSILLDFARKNVNKAPKDQQDNLKNAINFGYHWDNEMELYGGDDWWGPA